jgi:hypothetical protein
MNSWLIGYYEYTIIKAVWSDWGKTNWFTVTDWIRMCASSCIQAENEWPNCQWWCYYRVERWFYLCVLKGCTMSLCKILIICNKKLTFAIYILQKFIAQPSSLPFLHSLQNHCIHCTIIALPFICLLLVSFLNQWFYCTIIAFISTNFQSLNLLPYYCIICYIIAFIAKLFAKPLLCKSALLIGPPKVLHYYHK